MKTSKIKTVVALTGFVASLALQSCKKENSNLDFTTAYGQAFADESYNDVQNIADEAAQSGSVSFKAAEDNSITGCAIVTRDTVSSPRVTTIDFGTGCTGADGRLRQGQIIVTHTGPYAQQGTVITVTFNNYYVDGNQIQGTKVIENNGANTDGNLTFSVSVTGSITLANGAGTITWTSERVREWIAGSATPNRDDDQYSITGTADGVAANGDSFSATILQPLIRNLAPGCRRHFVSGEVRLERTGRPERLVNFGNGTCDNIAEVTINGVTHTITLH